MTAARTDLRVDARGLVRHLGRLGDVLDKDSLLFGIGLAHQQWIDENFETEGGKVGGWEPLSENTRAARAARGNRDARILQDTGQLRQSVDFEVSGSSVRVFVAKEYASYHNDGTAGPYNIFPKTGKALTFMTAGGKISVAHVVHPGLPQRRIVPLPEESSEIALDLIRARVAEIDRGFHGED